MRGIATQSVIGVRLFTELNAHKGTVEWVRLAVLTNLTRRRRYLMKDRTTEIRSTVLRKGNWLAVRFWCKRLIACARPRSLDCFQRRFSSAVEGRFEFFQERSLAAVRVAVR